MKTTLIIGASSGIGQALASQLLSRQEAVIGISRTMGPLAFTDYHVHDILSEAPLPAIESEIDGLVYCPGSIVLKPVKSLKKEDYMRDLEINVLGAIQCIQHYLPKLKLSTRASIVLFSTVAVQTGMAYHSSVAVSKGAVEGLTRSLAAELSPNIRVNCVAPSLTHTAMAEKLVNTPEKLEAGNQRHPLKRIGSASDISHAAEFLLSEKASWVTGQVWHIDGGIGTLRM